MPAVQLNSVSMSIVQLKEHYQTQIRGGQSRRNNKNQWDPAEMAWVGWSHQNHLKIQEKFSAVPLSTKYRSTDLKPRKHCTKCCTASIIVHWIRLICHVSSCGSCLSHTTHESASHSTTRNFHVIVGNIYPPNENSNLGVCWSENGLYLCLWAGWEESGDLGSRHKSLYDFACICVS